MTPAVRRALRARAHGLNAIVIVGAAGVTQSVIAAADEALCGHGLIKIRVNAENRRQRREMTDKLCHDTGAELIQTVGHVAVLFREPEDDKLLQAFLKILD